MPAVVAGLLAGVILGGISAALSLIRSRGDGGTAAGINFFGNLIITGFCVTWPVVGFVLPAATFFGVLPLIFLDLVLALIIAAIADGAAGGASVAPWVMLLAVLASGLSWVVMDYGPHDAKAAANIVHVTQEPGDALPASVTSDLVTLTPDQAATKASQAMNSGLSATRNYATYTNLGPATLQRVNGKMWYVFPLEFDGSGNKARLHAQVPGYIMVDAEDTSPQARPAEKYDGQFTMIVSGAGGQGSEPMRWVRDHMPDGTKYILQDPTFEVRDGDLHPFWTVTLLRPQLGQTFMAPVGVAVVDAHTGAITRYDLPGHGPDQLSVHAPWVDRVYSQDMAEQIANWYGKYGFGGGWPAFVGSSNANRFQVSGDPVLTYTGDENPSWRMLLTSYNSDTAVYRIIEMDSATGAMRVYRPQGPMGTESSVAQAFCNAQGLGAGNVRSNHLVPEHMTLHVIDGELVWMTGYESSKNGGAPGASASAQEQGDNGDPCGNGEAPADNPGFTGIGFVPAYGASASDAVFGSTREQALTNLFAEIAGQGSGQGSNPSAGAVEIRVTGTLCGKASDVSGGNQTYYLTLCGADGKPDTSKVYTGTSTVGPGLVLSQPGDKVVLKVLKATASNSQQQIQGFSDTQHPVGQGGSVPAPAASAPPAVPSPASS
jgi:hypothetical protein